MANLDKSMFFNNSLKNLNSNNTNFPFQVVAWQTCPICKGEGTSQRNKFSINNRSIDNCRVCNGKGIINIKDGNPPK